MFSYIVNSFALSQVGVKGREKVGLFIPAHRGGGVGYLWTFPPASQPFVCGSNV